MTSGMQKRAETQNLKVQNTHLFHIAVVDGTQPRRVTVEYCEDSPGRNADLL
jgi:hypothetical protein